MFPNSGLKNGYSPIHTLDINLMILYSRWKKEATPL